MVASLGGLGFAWRALGLVIPLYGTWVLDVRNILIMMIGFAGGPYAAIISGLLYGIPSGLPLIDLWYYPVQGLIMAAAAKTIWKNKGIAKYGLALITCAIANAIVSFFTVVVLSDYGFGLVAFWPYFNTIFLGGIYFIYIIAQIIGLFIALEFFPDYMKPSWSWKGGEELDDEDLGEG